jgi:hypothetical protein
MKVKFETLTHALLKEINVEIEGPCISMYMPTHRTHPENRQDPILFTNLVKEIRESLLQKFAPVKVDTLLEPFELLQQDSDFWNYTLNGLAVFCASGFFKVALLQLPVKALVIVAERFHTKPLRQYLQSIDRFHVLVLSQHEMQLFEGNRHNLAEIALPEDFPNTIEKALGEELTDKHLTVASYGGTGGESGNMHHGHGGKKEEVGKDAERFFQVVANAVQNRYSKPSGLPLILAALPEHHSLFQKVGKNPLLEENGILLNAKGLAQKKLAEMAWEVLLPAYELRLNNLKEKYGEAFANGSASDQVEVIARALAEGRVATLMLEQNRIIAGNFSDEISGKIEWQDIDNPQAGDLLNLISEKAIGMGAEVFVIPVGEMPVETGIAAIFRY